MAGDKACALAHELITKDDPMVLAHAQPLVDVALCELALGLAPGDARARGASRRPGPRSAQQTGLSCQP